MRDCSIPTFIRLDGLQTLPPHIPILLDELGQESPGREIPRHVDLDQHLAGAAVAGSDADGGDAQPAGDQASHFGWNGFEHQGKAACGLKRECVFENLEGAKSRLPLDSEAAEGVLSLGR